MFKEYLPDVGDAEQAKQIAAVSLNEARSKGRLHIAPAISPDGSQIAYFSERDGFSIDMFLADAATGQVTAPAAQAHLEQQLRDVPVPQQPGRVVAGRQVPRCDRAGAASTTTSSCSIRSATRRCSRITVKIDGLTTPSWSPDGKQLVFTGYDGGFSDLFIVNADGSGLKRLTNDQYADLHPAWSPDGKSIAFTTDRGPGTNFEVLSAGNFRIGLFDLASGETRVLDHMDARQEHQPGLVARWQVAGVRVGSRRRERPLPLRLRARRGLPAHPPADRLGGLHAAVAGAELGARRRQGRVHVLREGRLQRLPAEQPAGARAHAMARSGTRGHRAAGRRGGDARSARTAVAARPEVGEGGSIYRGKQGFRRADSVPKPAATARTRPSPSRSPLRALLDSATLALPDTSEFAFQKYRKHYTPDYVARPQIGYVRDNTGNGIYGSTAITLSDVLGNNQLAFGIAINGRINEAYRHRVVREPVQAGQLVDRRHSDPVLLRRAQHHQRPARTAGSRPGSTRAGC